VGRIVVLPRFYIAGPPAAAPTRGGSLEDVHPADRGAVPDAPETPPARRGFLRAGGLSWFPKQGDSEHWAARISLVYQLIVKHIAVRGNRVQ